jgi:carbon starvation protein
MTTLLIALAAFFGYLIAYHTYGRFLAKKIFRLDPEATVPSIECRDDIDYCPTRKQVIFGHHFTSIAGTGPIVGPAIAVFWGWLPALLWVLFGAIFIGAVHDFGALVVSLRNRGQTVGEVAGRLVGPRAKYLFLLVLAFALTIVLAIFGLVIANIFAMYPESVLSVWLAMPIAIAVGVYVYRMKGGLLAPSVFALVLLYAAVAVGVYLLPIKLPESWGSPVVVWTAVLFVYCFFASVLPVWLLLQPRDYVNSHQLLVALALLVAGIAVAGLSNRADINSAPAVVAQEETPADAPPILPFLFITIACGAVSGFHCLVSSGTTSKQLEKETDAQFVGYGSMLLEGVLAVLVIIACCAGIGLGKYQKMPLPDSIISHKYEPVMVGEGGERRHLAGREAWRHQYDPSAGWNNFTLGKKVGGFIDGGGNFLNSLGLPLELGIGVIAVLVACFAATTLDTATRLQRYVLQELAAETGVAPLKNKFVATGVAVALGFAIAMIPGKHVINEAGQQIPLYGTGGLILWPLFGATNQLLAGLAFMVTFFYLWRRGRPVWFIAPPMLLMLLLPAWALGWQMFNPISGWWFQENYLLFSIGAATLALQIWMIAEALIMIPKAKGVMEELLPPLSGKAEMGGGRSC